MNHILIPDLKLNLYVPSHLGECDSKQFGDMAKLIYWFHNGNITYEEFRSLAVYALTGMKRKKSKDEEIKFCNIAQLEPLVDDFFIKNGAEDGIQLQVKQWFMNNHLPFFKLWFCKYYGPDEAFENVKFGQYLDGLEEYINYSQTQEIKYLRNLFAIFYLPKGEKYNLLKSRNRAKGFFKNVDIRHLYGFYLTFGAIQTWMMSGEIFMGGNPIDLSIIFSGEESKSSIASIGMYSVAYDLAESGVFGNFTEIKEHLMWEVIPRLYQLRKNYLDDKKEQSKNESIPA